MSAKVIGIAVGTELNHHQKNMLAQIVRLLGSANAHCITMELAVQVAMKELGLTVDATKEFMAINPRPDLRPDQQSDCQFGLSIGTYLAAADAHLCCIGGLEALACAAAAMARTRARVLDEKPLAILDFTPNFVAVADAIKSYLAWQNTNTDAIRLFRFPDSQSITANKTQAVVDHLLTNEERTRNS